jgi:charged multivesicular body protein 4
MNLFGKKKIVFNPVEANKKLQDTLTLLEKREKHLENQVSLFRKEAAAAVKAKQKSKALFFLKKAKIYEKQISSIFNTKLNIETQIAALSQASINTETITAMKISRDVLINSEKTIEPEKVEEVMDDLENRLASVEEVSEIMGRPLGQQLDEDELLQELEAEIHIADIEKIIVNPVYPVSTKDKVLDIPSVPIEEKSKKEEDDELNELQKLMLA